MGLLSNILINENSIKVRILKINKFLIYNHFWLPLRCANQFTIPMIVHPQTEKSLFWNILKHQVLKHDFNAMKLRFHLKF